MYIYIFNNLLLYNSSITDIEHSPNYTAFIYIYIYIRFLPNQLGLQNTRTVPLERDKTPPTSVLDTTLKNLMVRLQ